MEMLPSYFLGGAEPLTRHVSDIGDVCQASVSELTQAYASRDLSPVDVTKATLERAEKINPLLNAFVSIDHEGAMVAARAAEKRWSSNIPNSPIDGVPTTIKDIVRCHGHDVRYGSHVSEDVSTLPDSPSVERLRQSGAVILGLTNTPEFGWKAVTDNPKYGVTRNPWSPSQTPGGSSGGAAAAAAAGAGVLHLGTDGGGSIRIPAAFCGIVGHKPSFGQVPAFPASSFGTVAHIGPMARTVEDTAHMLNAMSGKDVRDWTQTSGTSNSVDPKPINWDGLKIAYWKYPCVGGLDPEVEALVQATLRDLELAGCSIEEICLPDQDDLLEIFYRHWHVGAATRLSTIKESKFDVLDPGFLDAAMQGRKYSAVDRMQAEIARAQYGAKMEALFEECDYIISPTLPIPAFETGVNIPGGSNYKSWVEWSSYSYPINLSQQPACSVPCGQTEFGLPVGLQIIAARGDDEKVLSAALTYQHMYPDHFLFSDGHWPSCVSEVS